MSARYTLLDHPSDLGIEVRASTMAEAFEQAAAGMMSVIIDPSSVSCEETCEVKIEANHHEQLLIKWLSEVLYLYDGQQFIGKEFKVTTLTSTLLAAVITGERLRAESHRTLLDVKAVTYHQLFIQESEDGVVVRVFLDI